MTDRDADLADFAAGLRFEQLPSVVVEQALRVVRDTVGTMLAGSTLPEIKALADIAPSIGGGGGATLIGRSATVNPHIAALVNGTGGVSLELDEGNQYAINHPAVHIFPAVFAQAEVLGASGADVLAAFVAGYEIAVRAGRATKLRGPVHPFGTHAIVGTAAAISRLLRLDADVTARALELAAGLTIASSQSAATSGAAVRNLFTGLTNHNGLLAPQLARAGIRGEPGALGVVYGRVLGESFDLAGLTDDLGELFYITRNYFKIHACSRWNHAPIEATAALLEAHNFSADDIDAITVWTYNPATRLSGGQVANGYAGKHSIPYNVAARVVYGTNDLAVYSDDAVQDAHIQALLGRITVREDAALTAMLPDVRPARVELHLRDGKTLSKLIERPRGGFDNPLTEDELLAKFRRLAGMALPDVFIADLEALLPQLPELPNLAALSALLQGNAEA